MDKTCVLLLLDGLADRACPQLGHRTPLEAAHTPALDGLVAAGSAGLYHPTAVGQALPSENAHFALFGYGTHEFPGRGALEALGAGIPLGPDDVAVLAHLACLHAENGCLVHDDGAPRLEPGEMEQLFGGVARFAFAGIEVRLHFTGSRFGIITLRGAVAPFVTDTDPMQKGLPLMAPQPWQGREDEAGPSARALKAYLLWAHAELTRHPLNLRRREAGLPPVNGLVTQRAGRLKPVEPFVQRWGLKTLSIASGQVFRGLSAVLGFEHLEPPPAGDPEEEMRALLSAALAARGAYDFIHVHTKAPDEAAHTKDPRRKVEVIEAIDRGLEGWSAALAGDPRILLVVTADHSTPSIGPLIHSGEAVPLLMAGEGLRRDEVRRFDEVSVAGGALGLLRGAELMYLILNHLDRAKLVGLRDTPRDQPYWPGKRRPLRLEEDL